MIFFVNASGVKNARPDGDQNVGNGADYYSSAVRPRVYLVEILLSSNYGGKLT